MGIFALYNNQKLEYISKMNKEANKKQLELLETIINQNKELIDLKKIEISQIEILIEYARIRKEN